MGMNFSTPHSRYNPLINEWILVSPHRISRPWKEQEEKKITKQKPNYDPECSLCPENSRAKGEQNPPYGQTFSFINDYAAIHPESSGEKVKENHLFKAHSERGLCKVICYTPHHNLSMATMGGSRLIPVIDAWIDEWLKMREIDFLNHIQIFENHGEMMGCSSSHPHCQIWATESIPNIPLKEGKQQWLYYEEYDCCLLCSYLEAELKKEVRVVFENDHFVSLVPYWAVWPFETILLPKAHSGSFETLSPEQKISFAKALSETAIRYDNLFEIDFPYSMGIHQEPVTSNDENYPHWHWHVHFTPPLLRSATVQKFMVGYELFASPQRDVTPEEAAKQLREVSTIHYTKRN